jgi:hypothetical protein
LEGKIVPGQSIDAFDARKQIVFHVYLQGHVAPEEMARHALLRNVNPELRDKISATASQIPMNDLGSLKKLLRDVDQQSSQEENRETNVTTVMKTGGKAARNANNGDPVVSCLNTMMKNMERMEKRMNNAFRSGPYESGGGKGAVYYSGGYSGGKGKGKGKGRKCWGCDGYGHEKKDCPSEKQKKGKGKGKGKK